MDKFQDVQRGDNPVVETDIVSLVSREDGHVILALSAGPFVVTTRGLLINGDPSLDECMSFGAALYMAKGVILWALADLLNYAEMRYGETYAQLAAAFPDFSIDYLRHIKWVGSVFPRSERFESLSFDHHRVVAALPREERLELLAMADRDGLSRQELKEIIKERKERDSSTAKMASFFARVGRARMYIELALENPPNEEVRDALLLILSSIDDIILSARRI